ncbi:MAG: hypothetical protein ACOC02_05395, partial [Guyparkeria sp.]
MRSLLTGHRWRRWALAAWFISLLVAALPVRAADTAPRIATLDWTVAETLIGIDARLVGLAQL